MSRVWRQCRGLSGRPCSRLVAPNAPLGRCAACFAEHMAARASGWSGDRNRVEQARFRKLLGTAAGWRCQAVGSETFPDLPEGERCPRTVRDGCQAHHGKDGHPDAFLCDPHHAMVDPHARVVRR